jgi:hypothetical protein
MRHPYWQSPYMSLRYYYCSSYVIAAGTLVKDVVEQIRPNFSETMKDLSVGLIAKAGSTEQIEGSRSEIEIKAAFKAGIEQAQIYYGGVHSNTRPNAEITALPIWSQIEECARLQLRGS